MLRMEEKLLCLLFLAVVNQPRRVCPLGLGPVLSGTNHGRGNGHQLTLVLLLGNCYMLGTELKQKPVFSDLFG